MLSINDESGNKPIQYKINQKTTKARNERDEILDLFIERLNKDRISNGFKPMSSGIYAIKMAQAGIKTLADLKWFYGYLSDAKSFSATWWWYVKEKKIKV
jgi:acyl-CoA hydrolase